jgi:hypothetical protein
MHAIKKGLLWQHRDRMFSRWKERYFILTRDYLHCFKRASGSGSGKISEMGQFIFKVNISFVLVHRHLTVLFNVALNLCDLMKHGRKKSLEKN